MNIESLDDLKQAQRPLRGAILSAGLGTRLRPLTALRPKPLVPVAGRPLIEWNLLALAQAGISTVGVNTHYLGEQLTAHLDETRLNMLASEVTIGSAPPTLEIVWSHEPTLLGTGGGIRALADALTDALTETSAFDLLCVNGDALFDFELAPLVRAHRESRVGIPHTAVAGTLALREVPMGDPFGRVGVDAEGRVVRIAEVKGPRSKDEVRVGAFTGAQIITPEALRYLEREFSDVFRVAHRALLAREAEVRAHFVPTDSLWVDVGTTERYLGAHELLLHRPYSPLWRYVPPHKRLRDNIIFEGAELDERITLKGGVWVGSDARVRCLDHDVGGARHTMTHTYTPLSSNRAELMQSVVWPKAQVEARSGERIMNAVYT